MKIVVIGAGFTGMQLARELVAEKNEVVLIERDPEKVRHASDQLDCTVLEADGSNLESLEDAGLSSADALVTLTEDDELNMITCSLVDAVYPDIAKIARVRNYAYYLAADAARRRTKSARPDARPLYGIDTMLNPDVEAASAIVSAIEHGAVGNVIELGGGFGIAMLSVGEGSPLVGLTLREIAPDSIPVNILHPIEGTPLAGGQILAFKYGYVENGELLLRVYPTESIEAGVPYLISWADGENIVSPLFKNITISASTGQSIGENDDVHFVGIFAPETFPKDDKTKLFVLKNNQIAWSGFSESGHSLKSFRAYFQTTTAVGSTNAPIRHGMPARIVLQEQTATGSENIETGVQSIKILENNQVVIIRNGLKYNLQGQRIQ